jgi:hypothetical protein
MPGVIRLGFDPPRDWLRWFVFDDRKTTPGEEVHIKVGCVKSAANRRCQPGGQRTGVYT